MGKVSKVRRKTYSCHHQATLHPFPSCSRNHFTDVILKKSRSKASEKKDWKHATCSVCLEYPHNAVLLLCSSYDKGCRPYMCSTSHRYSNCLEQYKKAYTKITPVQSSQHSSGMMESSSSGLGHCNKKIEVSELLCPLCRGQVKGWTVVEPARKYLNAKKRACMQNDCSFVGSYKELRKHVRAKHPLACPRAVDPLLEEKWKRLECEREQNDVISTIISSTPGAMVLGDYVIEPNYGGSYSDYDSDLDDYSDDYSDDSFFPLASLNHGQNRGISSQSRYNRDREFVNYFGRRRATAFRSDASYGRSSMQQPYVDFLGRPRAAAFRSDPSYGRSFLVARSRRQWRH
ncbi:uncharacterized protein LOC122309951 [Carya illinoinensis]|uniref:Uncharacterized protein n=1 Tax=Carya illinoinensis TaxID=32201 RepID=A0A8T1QM98_CARIL|nr:uncharacterized protein LOC122309951 [Carya illinoinensis]XP_042979700.1 uncharacterized protein LOC122309951 [Carya illinoinensis]KAG6655597.1 hypothetical protein CIPAW_05G228200 [Carya illinoinensis]